MFHEARRTRPPAPQGEATLLTPTVVVNEVRAAALVTHSQIGTVTVKKERDKAAAIHPHSEFKVNSQEFGHQSSIPNRRLASKRKVWTMVRLTGILVAPGLRS